MMKKMMSVLVMALGMNAFVMQQAHAENFITRHPFLATAAGIAAYKAYEHHKKTTASTTNVYNTTSSTGSYSALTGTNSNFSNAYLGSNHASTSLAQSNSHLVSNQGLVNTSSSNNQVDVNSLVQMQAQ